MESFYNEVLDISTKYEMLKKQTLEEHSTIDEKTLLESHIEEVINIIEQNYKNNIISSAQNNIKCAILCIYFKNAKYRGVIGLHSLLTLPPNLEAKFQTYGIEKLMDRLAEKFKPFLLEIHPLEEIIDIYSQTFNIIGLERKDELENTLKDDVYAIVAKW